MKKLAKILIPVFVLALVVSCVFVFASADDTKAASVTIGETTTEYATLDAAIEAANAASGEGAVVKLLKDIMVTDTVATINSVDFTLDLNGHRIGWNNSTGWQDEDGYSKALFIFDVPEGETEANVLITGNGKIHLTHAAIFKTAVAEEDELVAVNFGAREAFDEEYNRLDVPELNTGIVVTQIGQARAFRLTNDTDCVYMQNVQMFFEASNNVQDKVDGVNARIGLETNYSYIRMVNCEIQDYDDSPTTSPLTQSIFFISGGANGIVDSYLSFENSYAGIYGGFIGIKRNVTTEEEDAILYVENSTVIARDKFEGRNGDYVSATAAGYLLALSNTDATAKANVIVNDSIVTTYRMAEGDNDEIGITLVTKNTVYRQIMHYNNNVFNRAAISVKAEDCFFSMGSAGFMWNVGSFTGTKPTYTFTNCRFNQKPTGNAATNLNWSANGSYDFSNSEYPYVVNAKEGTPKETAPEYVIEATGDNKLTGTKTGNTYVYTNSYLTENVPKNDKFSYGNMYPGTSADGNGYAIYKITDGNKTYGSVNNPSDPYFGLGHSLSTSKSYPIYDGAKWTGRIIIYEFDFAAGVNGFARSSVGIGTRNGVQNPAEGTGNGNGFDRRLSISFDGYTVYGANGKTLTVNPEEWHHYTATLVPKADGSGYTFSVYVDGELFASENFAKMVAGKYTVAETLRWTLSGGNQTIGTAIAFDNARSRIYSSADANITLVPTTTPKGYSTHEAEVGGKFYNTLSEALAAAKSYEVVTLKKDVVTALKLAEVNSNNYIFSQRYEAYNIYSAVEELSAVVDPTNGNVYGAVWSDTKPATPKAQFNRMFPGNSDNYTTSTYVYLDEANPLKKATYAIYDTEGNILSYGTDATQFWNAMNNPADGVTIKLFDDILHTGSRIEWTTAGARTIDLNGHRLTKTNKSQLLVLKAENSSLTITSSRAGAEILAYREYSHTIDDTFTLNYGEALFVAENANQTVTIDGKNLTISAVNLFDTAISNQEAPYNNIKLVINGGTYVQLGRDCWGYIMIRNSATGENATTVDIKNANFIDTSDKYTTCTTISFYADATSGSEEEGNLAHRRPTGKVTIDNCSFTSLNSKNDFIQRLANGATVTVTNTSFDGYSFATIDTVAANLTLGANVTSSLPFPVSATYAEGCANYALLIPTANKLVGEATAVTMKPTYKGGDNRGPLYLYYNSVNQPGGLAAPSASGEGLDLLWHGRGETSVEGVIANGYTAYKEVQGYDTFTEVTVSLTEKTNALYATSGTYAPVNCVKGTETLATYFVPADTTVDAIKAATLDLGGSVAGLFDVTSWKITDVTFADGAFTAVVEEASVTNKLSVATTLVLQDNFIYTILLKADMLQYVTKVELDGQVIYTAGQTVKTVMYGTTTYVAFEKALAPAEVGEEFSFVVSYKAGAIEHSANWTFSIAQYAMAVLNAQNNATVNDAAKQLVAEALNYIKVIYAYDGKLVSDDLAAAIAAYEAAGFTTTEAEATEYAAPSIDGVESIALVIGTNGFKLRVTLDQTADVTVVIGGETVVLNKDTKVQDVTIDAYEIARSFTIAGTEYSVLAYLDYLVANAEDTSEEYLAKAIKAYAVAADAYMVSMGN